MAKPKLAEMRIRPAKNGGHNVRHEFAPTPKMTRGLAGGMSMDHIPAEEHNFGPGDGKQLMQHIATRPGSQRPHGRRPTGKHRGQRR